MNSATKLAWGFILFGIAAILAMLFLFGDPPAKITHASLAGTMWSDPKAPANTFTFKRDGTCEAVYKFRTYAGNWHQHGDAVEFNISGDNGSTVFHMTLNDDGMGGDAIPPGGGTSFLVSLIPLKVQPKPAAEQAP